MVSILFCTLILLSVEEDTYGNYSRLLLKYFSAEAAMTGHSLVLTSGDQDPSQILKVCSSYLLLMYLVPV